MTFGSNAIVCVLGVGVLAGCGGGGGDSSPAGFSGFSRVGPNDTATLTGQAVVADFTYDEASGRGTLQNVLRAPAEFVGVYQDGELIAVRGSSSGTSFDVDRRNGGFIESDGTTIIAENEITHTELVYYEPSVGDFEYQNLGTWTNGEETGRISVASVGLPTAPNDLPGVTATYSGYATGISERDGEMFYTVAGATVRTNFATATLSTTDTMKISLDTEVQSSASDHDLSGTLQISGSGLSGKVTSGVGSGTASGSFYGPQAAEVGGTFEVSGTGEVHIGAFGARR